jgi:hypothetical protein
MRLFAATGPKVPFAAHDLIAELEGRSIVSAFEKLR